MGKKKQIAEFDPQNPVNFYGLLPYSLPVLQAKKKKKCCKKFKKGKRCNKCPNN